MSKTWFVSDTHFGHENIIKFKDKDGDRIRPFSSVEEHDQVIIDNINKVVSAEDRLYMMGDIAIGRRHIATIGKLNGRKKLLKGNHDIFKLVDYSPYFEDIVSYRVYPEHGFLFSHIPVHPSQLEFRFKLNFHGHLHSNVVLDDAGIPDKRYVNLCLEHTSFGPVNLQDLIDKFSIKG